ncbi:MAG TPA: peptide chain release factor N(5)-glutamine methyltransferase [Stellaceae bacterium]|jgi:release factor glutamine methyltransferase|nr:peptide chain release factor N(5)-glutamine methyltransferase [Stellaceae bacterium]
MAAGTVGAILDEVRTSLAIAGFDEPRRRARRLAAAALAMSATEVFVHPERPIAEADAERVAALLRRVLAHEPLSRVLGVREFWGLEFGLSPDTLDPRPETETVVEAVLARLPERGREYRVLDLGTGSGCLLLALLSELPGAHGVGVDRALGAAVAARDNAVALGLAGRAGFVVGDWAAAICGRFDIIVSNPPYIATETIASLPPEVRDFDPRRALDGGVDGLDAYRRITLELPQLLRPGGLFVVEVGVGQERTVAALLAAEGLLLDGFAADLAGILRCVVARPV